MISLPNGCHCSEMTVFPKNWDKPGSSVKKDWYLSYRFYDPSRVNTKGQIVNFEAYTFY